jgi:hypothetical protein
MQPEHYALLTANPTFEADLGANAAGAAPPAPRRLDVVPEKER